MVRALVNADQRALNGTKQGRERERLWREGGTEDKGGGTERMKKCERERERERE
jgi:hypothetical protein